FGKQAQARAVPENQLHSVGPLRTEAEDHARERIGLQLLLHQRRKPVHPFTEVHRLRRHQHPDWAGRDQHAATHAFERRTARKTASTSRALAPPGTRTLMVPSTISIKAGRRSCAALFAAAVSTTTGTKLGIASAGSAKRPSLAALIQFDRCCGARSCRRATSAITAPGTIASATIRPFSPSLHRRRRTTLVTSARRRTTFVSSLMSTIMCTRSQGQETRDRAPLTLTQLCGAKTPLTFLARSLTILCLL